MAGNVALKELNLSWNNLRQESAAAIGRSLNLNCGLVSLNLAHNAFNNLPSQEVGDSLRTNSTLQVCLMWEEGGEIATKPNMQSGKL